MKRFFISLVLILATGQFVFSQDLNRLMEDLAKIENTQHQIVDSAMLRTSLDAAIEADQTGQLASQMPPFMRKMESIEVVNLEGCSQEEKSKFLTELENFKDGNGYETLVFVKDDGDKVRIVSKKNENAPSEVFIFVVDEEDAVFVKMRGLMNESDLSDIIKEQTRKNK